NSAASSESGENSSSYTSTLSSSLDEASRKRTLDALNEWEILPQRRMRTGPNLRHHRALLPEHGAERQPRSKPKYVSVLYRKERDSSEGTWDDATNSASSSCWSPA